MGGDAFFLLLTLKEKQVLQLQPELCHAHGCSHKLKLSWINFIVMVTSSRWTSGTSCTFALASLSAVVAVKIASEVLWRVSCWNTEKLSANPRRTVFAAGNSAAASWMPLVYAAFAACTAACLGSFSANSAR